MWSFSIFYWVSLVIGLLYPMYASYKALLTPGTADDTHWLTYFIVYSALESFEAVVEQILWIPFYYELKCLLLLWMVSPATKGAQLIFEKGICPFLQHYASQIDPAFNKTNEVLRSKQMSGFVTQAQGGAKRFAS